MRIILTDKDWSIGQKESHNGTFIWLLTLCEEQLSELKQAVSPVSNIKVIDFNTIPLQELEEIRGISASELTKLRYSNDPKLKNIPLHTLSLKKNS